MRNYLERTPLHIRLLIIGFIPLLFAIILSIKFFSEKERKHKILNEIVSRVDQSMNLTRLIDGIQLERNYSFLYALEGINREEMLSRRKYNDSLVQKLEEGGVGFSGLKQYTLLAELQNTRRAIDSSQYDANSVIHYYSTLVFRLNTLNPIMPVMSVQIPSVYPDFISQKLLSDMITYQSLVNTNVFYVLHTKRYGVETLIGTVGTYQVYKSYEKEFLLKGKPEAIARYNDLKKEAGFGAMVNYVDTLFSRFAFDSSYNSTEWAALTSQGMNQLRELQQDLVTQVEKTASGEYLRSRRSGFVTGILLTLLVLGVAGIIYYTIFSIARTLSGLKRSAEVISSGAHLEKREPVANDVLGSLASSIYRIDESNRHIATTAQKIGKGDFSIDFRARSEDDLLGLSIITMKDELQKFTRKLAEREEYTWRVIQTLPVAIYACDPNGKLIFSNPAAVELWGGQSEKNAFWNGAWKIYDRTGKLLMPEEYPMARLLRGKREGSPAEIIIERRDGTRRIVLPHPQLLLDDDGKVTGGINLMIDVTERRSAEKDQARLASLVQSTVDAIISKTTEGIVTSWNPGAERLFGYKAKEMIGQHISKVIPPDRLHEEPEILGRIGRGERIDHFETERIHKDGRRLHLSLSISPIIDDAGQIIGASKIARDITEKVESERKIYESEERLRMAVSTTHLGMWDYFPKTNEVVLSEECRMIFGLSNEEDLSIEKLLSRVHADDHARVRKEIDAVFIKGNEGTYTSTFRIVPAGSNEIRWLHTRGKVMFDQSGTPTRFLATVIDITEQKRAEQAIRDSAERTSLALEAAQMGSFEWDLITQQFISSRRLNEIMGHPGENIGHELLLTSLHPADKPIRDKAVEEAMKRGDLNYEVRILWPDASLHWVRVFGKIIFDEQQKPLRMYGTVEDVTEDHITLQKLEESTERLKLVIETAEMGTWELDIKTDHATYSDRYLKLFGYSSDAKPTHAELKSRIHPDDLPARNEAVEESLRTGILDFEVRIFTLKNDMRWFKVRGAVFKSPSGEPERMLGTILDVTDQKNSFHALQESEERFKTIANTAPVMIWMSGEDRFVNFFNTSWLDFTGRTIDQERNNGWIKSVHPDDKDYCQEIYNRAHAARRPFSMEFRLRRRDGVYRWISGSSVPRFDGNGGFLGFISACRDIDDERRFNQMLQESELLFKTITNVAPVGLWMTDDKGNNNFVNDTWIEWTGKPIEQQYSEGWLSVVIAADQDYIGKKFNKAFEARRPFHAEFRIKRKDGQVRWVLSEGSPYYDIDGEFAGYAGSVADITERKEDEIRRNEFLAVASHELKTPLTSVKAYAQLLASTYKKSTDEFLKNGLRKVENQVNKMTKLVTDFLNLSKIESDKFELDLDEFDLNILAKETVSDVEMVSQNHHIRLEGDENVMVNADREKIAQVIINFLNNAVKYSPEGKDVTVTVKKIDGHARLEVKDQGIGIKQEEHQRIFQRFYRSRFHQNISYSGFGIGLYISAEIIQLHEGTIGVESKEGEGATFFFMLPLVNNKV